MEGKEGKEKESKGGQAPAGGDGGIHNYGSNETADLKRFKSGLEGSAGMEQDPQDPMTSDPPKAKDGDGIKQGGKAGEGKGDAGSPDGKEGEKSGLNK